MVESGIPSIRTSPLVGSSSPSMILIRVVLPPPDGPVMVTNLLFSIAVDQLVLASGELLPQGLKALLLLKDGYLAFPELDVGHVSLRPEPCCRRHKILGDLHALTLG